MVATVGAPAGPIEILGKGSVRPYLRLALNIQVTSLPLHT